MPVATRYYMVYVYQLVRDNGGNSDNDIIMLKTSQ